MSIFAYNGGAVVAMMGKDSIAIASDNRLGTQFNTIARNNIKVHQVGKKVFVGLPGLETDNQTLLAKIKFRMNMFRLREEREMPVKAVAAMLGNLLYEHRWGMFFVEPVVAGLDDDGKPYCVAFDSIGAGCAPDDFVVTGTAQDSLLGMCESLWRPDMDEDELFEVTSQALMASLDRDCLAGWGATVKILTADGKCTTRQLKTRMD
eukprot:TRINITY_DN32483_c0_g1_i1.p2 TRINITY_DN32483_c0_g1~~TRINITY_DN32483_c0_g1_i1.p2  ORF type:complete len:221 (+),score=102.05 TRINITY_DN32483_c0_g1_i1:48-665(+)